MIKKNSKVVDFKVYSNEFMNVDFIVAVIKNDKRKIEVPILSTTWHVDYCNTISIVDGETETIWLPKVLTDSYNLHEVLLKKDITKMIKKVKKALEDIVFEDDFIFEILKKLKK